MIFFNNCSNKRNRCNMVMTISLLLVVGFISLIACCVTGFVNIDGTTTVRRRRSHHGIKIPTSVALQVQQQQRQRQKSPSFQPQPLSSKSTVQDETIDSPASIVFYDDVLDDDIPDGVVCARGVCVLADLYDDDDDDDFDFDDETTTTLDDDDDGRSAAKKKRKRSRSIVDKVLNSYLGPRALLAFASILYGTNFPLGAIMNNALPPSAATCSRMVLAALALSPFLPKLSPKLSMPALLCGCFTALGYTTQSLALVDVSPATVAFLGAATVVVCPTLEALVDKKPMSIQDAPQTWLAALLCLMGVGILELYDPNGGGMVSEVGWGDLLAILQAVGFGTSFFLTERMMRGQPDQALPITAVQVSVTAFICMLWCFVDGWMFQPGTEAFALPTLFLEPSLRTAAVAVAWTGLITTAMNRFVETSSLGKVASAEASVILATEPLWAALFAALWIGENFGINDYVGGALIVLACLANTLKQSDFSQVLGDGSGSDATIQEEDDCLAP